MCPPFPLRSSSRAMRAPACTVTLDAVSLALTEGPLSGAGQRGADRDRAAAGLARGIEPRASRRWSRRRSATTSIAPPAVPGARPVAASWPLTMIEPPMPFSATVPACRRRWRRGCVPPASTRFCTMPSAARAVSCTVPPSARMVPVLVTSAVTVLPSGADRHLRHLLGDVDATPARRRTGRASRSLAPASTTWPSLAVITPELATCGATSAASPACLTVMVPALSIRALGLPGWSNTMRPAMKFWLVMPAAETTRPGGVDLRTFVEGDAVLVDQDHLAVGIDPAGDLRRVGPITRLSATALVTKAAGTAPICCAPTSKLCQLIAARWRGLGDRGGRWRPG